MCNTRFNDEECFKARRHKTPRDWRQDAPDTSLGHARIWDKGLLQWEGLLVPLNPLQQLKREKISEKYRKIARRGCQMKLISFSLSLSRSVYIFNLPLSGKRNFFLVTFYLIDKVPQKDFELSWCIFIQDVGQKLCDPRYCSSTLRRWSTSDMLWISHANRR